MSRSGNFVVLVNPAAGRGRRGSRVRDYLELLRQHLGPFEPVITQRAGDEVPLLDRALADGVERVVAIGGDGTWGAAADRILCSGRADVELGLLPAGTGNDFGKSLGIRHEAVPDVVRAIADRRVTTIDAGRVGDRYFLNVVGLGFDIAVIDDAEHTPLLRGDLLYRFCAVKQLFRFPGRTVVIEVPGRPPQTIQILMLTVSNGNYFGGSFHIAPRASLNDGRLDLVAIRDAGPLARARLFSQVSRGTHEDLPEVVCIASPSFTIRSEGTIRYEADGDVYAAHDALTVTSVPSALRLYAPPPAEAAA
jgi:diacylglycerol kinase (ATP)